VVAEESSRQVNRRQTPSSLPLSKGERTTLIEFLQNIQRDLFKIGAELASLQTSLAAKVEKINSDRVGEMEKIIDEFWMQLPELKNFILPGGSLAGAHLHLARAICRRAERELVAFGNQLLKSEDRSPKSNIRPELYTYLNRLSDFLFASARWVNFKAGEEEIKI
jgi:cob(I)alamin adenosyltransferase